MFAYLALAAMLYFFFGQFVPELISFKVRQNRLAQGRNQNIVTVMKTFKIEIYNIYHHSNRTEIVISQQEESLQLFKGVYFSDLKTMADEGIWLRQNKRCSDILSRETPYSCQPQMERNEKQI